MPQHTTATRPFGAVLTAMVTPMRADGSVDLEAAAVLAKHLVAHGNDGIVLNGTTGEAPTTHAPEKSDLIRAVVEAVGDDAVVLAGAGSNDTAHAVRMAEQAAEAGAHGLLVVSPYYSRPSQAGVIAHVSAIADSTELPVMLYDVPVRTGVRFAGDTLATLAEHARVVAIKDATGDLEAAVVNQSRTGLAWYSGDDALVLAFLAHGGVGVVSMVAHIAGDRVADAVRSFHAGDVSAARDHLVELLPAIDIISGSGNGALRSKLTLWLLGILPSAAMRLPHVEADADEVDRVRAALRAAGLEPVR